MVKGGRGPAAAAALRQSHLIKNLLCKRQLRHSSMTDLTENAANVASDVVGSIHARPKPAADGAPSPKRNKVDHPATLAVGASDTRNAGSNDALSSSAEASTPRSSPEPGSRGTGPGKRARGDGLSEKNWYQQKKDRNKQQKNRKSEEKKEGKAEQKSETRNSDAPKDLRKRKVAFLFGYNGDGFQGLQAQSTTENTIEHVLETAMHKAGAISVLIVGVPFSLWSAVTWSSVSVSEPSCAHCS